MNPFRPVQDRQTEQKDATLLDLAFAKLDMLPCNRIVLSQRQLSGHVPRVLSSYVKEPGIGG